MKKESYKTGLKVGRTRSFRLDYQQELKLNLLAAYFDTSRNTVIRMALDNFWEKSKHRRADIDQKEVNRQFFKVLDRVFPT